MKILHITPSYKPAYVYGGPTMSVSELCEKLAESNHDVTVYTTTANGSSELDVKTGIEVVINHVKVFYFPRITKDHTHFSPKLLVHLNRTISGYDVVHIHSWWNLIAMFSVLICLGRRIIPVFSPRGMLSPFTLPKNGIRMMFHRLIGKYLLKKIVLHATSNQELLECKGIINPVGEVVLPNFVRLNSKNAPVVRKLPDSEINFVFLSRVHEKKGLEFTFRVLHKINSPWKLTIYGNGDTDYINSLKALSVSLGIESGIKWMGSVEGDQKFEKLSDADFFILLSQNENFANVVVESLSVGTPVIISDCVGLSDYVRQHEFGYITELNEPSCVELINHAVNNLSLNSNIRSNAPAKIRRDFTSAVLTDHYIDLYSNNIRLNGKLL